MTIGDLLRAIRRRMGLLTRYAVSGGLGAALQATVLYVWVSLLGLEEHYLGGAVLGFCFALLVSFLLQKYWTFKDSSMHRTRRQLTLYGAVAVGNLLVNIMLLAVAKELVTAFGADFFNGWYIVAQIVIVLIASAGSFLVNYFVTFKDATVPPRVSPAEL